MNAASQTRSPEEPGIDQAIRHMVPRWPDSWFRSLVLSKLSGLRGGAVTIAEGDTDQTVGDSSPPARHGRIDVHSAALYRHLVLGGSLGAAESFIRGHWSSPDLTGLLRVFARDLAAGDRLEQTGVVVGAVARVGHWLRRNTRRGSASNIHAHYDLGNDFFRLMLDPTMAYSCGVFETADATMEEASAAKFERVCRKLALQPGDHVLEIGTGWGGFALHAAGRYGCRVTTTTISAEQHRMASERIAAAGLTDRVTLLQQDYRDLTGTYDKLVSIEMIEAVGHEFLDGFFRVCCDRLRPDGLGVIQAITMPDFRYEQYRRSVDFINTYIFPGGCLPALGAMTAAIGRATDFRAVHLEDLTPHYVTTLQRWREQVVEHESGIRGLGYDERFLRTWHYYLSYCEAAFAERYVGNVQITLARPRCVIDAPLPAIGKPAA
ncbi:MAG: cyclopropane-fatty-acyl-phospholipid synthase family protein [Vicinamibacterales bacterium]|nr:cyclopropane-fatty-acyl-phospholipid synthase family protein [Vicinamibacterales bacterium]